MKKNRYAKSLKGILMILFLTLLFCFPAAVPAQSAGQSQTVENRRVLFISSYSYAWSTVPLQLEGIEDSLDDSVTLDIEFMDTKKINIEMAEQILLEKIRLKQKNEGQYDAVIVGDDPALVFATKYKNSLFQNTPIVFEGVNNIGYARKVSKDSLVTGVIERIPYDENLEFAKKIQPDAKKVVAIVDNTVTGLGEQQQLLAQEIKHPELSFEMLNGSLLSKRQMIERISEINSDTILIYLILSEDADGNIYTNEQVCQMLKEHAKVPVFRFVQAGIGEGVLGGKIVLHKESGMIAADMVMQILWGTDPADLPIREECPTGYYLDQNVLDQFGISNILVPDGAQIMNQKENFWDRHGFELILIVCISAGVMLITSLSMRAVYVRRRYAELQKTNQKLESAAVAAQAATRAKSIFLHSISHDIRTPMNAIIGFSNLAIQKNRDETVGKYLQKIVSSSEHLLSLIREVLDISRIENGKTVYHPVPVRLEEITDKVLDIVQGLISDKQLTLCTDISQENENTVVLTDPVHVREVLVNILSNAIKFTDSGGTITFVMKQNPGADDRHIVTRYMISDTGCGMSEEFLPHVFDEFSQEESGARTHYRGTGLGMSITKRYVDMMGGTIQVKSKQGEGTTFIVELPMELTSEAVQTLEPFVLQQQDTQTGNSSKNVLIVEDNDLNAEVLMVQFENLGISFERAENGRKAVEAFAQNAPGTFDIILMDIMMPEMDGYEATRLIRGMSGRPDGKTIPIIAMTANAFKEDVQASLDAGMNEHLTKPLAMDELLKTMEKYQGREKS